MKKQPKEQLSLPINPVLALGPDDPDDGDEGRQRRGLAIAAMIPITRNRLGYQVPSLSGTAPTSSTSMAASPTAPARTSRSVNGHAST